ncbi:hypothetical protein GOODEAATRI_027953 [Goodea atripinnis]|uniref:Uncharacterized protein n=1 Tax=Goodea atripinnis TaxID=208336 RepID=A0ABV0N4V3_9TELE
MTSFHPGFGSRAASHISSSQLPHPPNLCSTSTRSQREGAYLSRFWHPDVQLSLAPYPTRLSSPSHDARLHGNKVVRAAGRVLGGGKGGETAKAAAGPAVFAPGSLVVVCPTSERLRDHQSGSLIPLVPVSGKATKGLLSTRLVVQISGARS